MPRWTIAIAVGLMLGAPLRAEDRQLVELPDMMREHMMANMRDHLAALAQAQSLAAAQQWDRASELVERRLGMSSLDSHGAAHMAPYMPPAMQEMGTEMHRSASRLSRALAEEDPPKTFAAFAEVMERCTACHGAFRIH